MTKLEKFLRKLTSKRRAQIEPVIAKIASGDFSRLNVVKLGGSDSLFRVRQGDIRIFYTISEGQTRLLWAEFRGDHTYHF